VVRDRGVRGSVASTPWEENAHALRKPARPERVASEVGPPKRSSDVVKRPVPRSRRKEPYPPCGSALRKWREEIGNTRGAGARSSIGWQTSVESIARRERRRSQGLLANGTLARKKSVTPPDAECGRTEGEEVCVGAAS